VRTLDLRHLVHCAALRVLADTNSSECTCDGILEAWVEADLREEAAAHAHRLEVAESGWDFFADLCWRTIVPLDVALAVSINV
jgi:hypothetical protein